MYRLKKYKKGWIVEREINKWHLFYGVVKKWKHITHYSGMPENPYYYKTAEGARDGALSHIKNEINHSFYYKL